jgi:hypothetical protein
MTTTTMTTGGPTLNSTCSAIPLHARDVASNSATQRVSLPHLSSDPVQPSRGSPRVFVASPGASSILLVPALTTIFVYPMVTKSMQLAMGVVVPPRTMTKARTTGRLSRLRTWVGRFHLYADGHLACLGQLVVFARRCMTFLYSRACSISAFTRTYLTVTRTPHTGRQNLSFFVRFFFMRCC